MSSALEDYFAALERLKKDIPEKVPKGTSINKDSVALEAGRSRGSIKKSRAMFTYLIAAIEASSQANKQKKLKQNNKQKN